jgi:hypothetical protein
VFGAARPGLEQFGRVTMAGARRGLLNWIGWRNSVYRSYRQVPASRSSGAIRSERAAAEVEFVAVAKLFTRFVRAS